MKIADSQQASVFAAQAVGEEGEAGEEEGELGKQLAGCAGGYTAG